MATRRRRNVGQPGKSRDVGQRLDRSLTGRRQAPSRSQVVLVYLFLAAITWLVFGQTMRHDFVNFDDHVYAYAVGLCSLCTSTFAWALFYGRDNFHARPDVQADVGNSSVCSSTSRFLAAAAV